MVGADSVISTEAKFIRWCASRNRIDNAQYARTLIESGVEWTRVLATARWHGVVPLLHTAIIENGVTEIPGSAAFAIRSEFLRQSADSLLYARELARIMTALEENSVRAVAFKGPGLAIRLYGTASLRQCRDLDLLVADDDIAKALHVLHSYGYERSVNDGLDHRIVVHTEKDYLLVHDRSLFKIELHWAIATPSFYVQTPFDEIWRRRQYISVLDQSVAVPHIEDSLLLLCVHGTRHSWSNLKWICDIDEIVRQCPEIEWQRLYLRANELGCRRMLLVGLTVAREVLGTDLPAVIERKIHDERGVEDIAANLSAILLSRTEGWFHYERIVAHVRSHDRWCDRARMIASYVGGGLRPDERDREFIRLPSWLSFLYWPLRIVRVLWRHWHHAGKPLLSTLMHRSTV